MGKLDSMESKPPQRVAVGGGGNGGGSSLVVVVNGNGNNNNHGGGELTPLSKTAPERIKRDEWSEGAVTTLLDAYESKWLLRNRAKLKGNDWEEVARMVSTRAEGGKSAKTQTQCKNKIESMKKRYRSESASANANASSWPLYARMDNLLRCRAPLSSLTQTQTQTHIPAPAPAPIQLTICAPPPDLPLQEAPIALPPQPPPPPPPPLQNGQAGEEVEEEAEQPQEEEVRGGNGGFGEGSNQEDGSNTLPNRKESAALDTDTSTPRSKIANAADDPVKEIAANCNFSCKRRKTSSPGSGSGGGELAESIRSFADTIVKLEHAKMRMYKDSERLRAETEVRRGELELKRTEMIAKTQLQIARLLSGKTGKRKPADRNSTLALSEAAAQPPSHPLLHD